MKYQEEIKKVKNQEKWDLIWLDMCDWISNRMSKDPSTKAGCVIVDNLNRIISIGYNGFPKGIEDKPEWYEDRDIKYPLVCHNERNALDNAPCGDVRGMTLYSSSHPCKECQKGIIQKGIKRVVWYKSDEDFMERWKPNSFPFPLELANIEMKEYNRPLIDLGLVKIQNTTPIATSDRGLFPPWNLNRK